MTESLAVDASLEKTQALHRVWKALNDGNCPNCCSYYAATDILRDNRTYLPMGHQGGSIQCPGCMFYVLGKEIEEIESLFAPVMRADFNIFKKWRASQQPC